MAAALAVSPAAGGPDDGDGDGVAGAADSCPDLVGAPPDGCPPEDQDGDSVVDRRDRCPQQAGPISLGGCPDLDRDRDRVVDRRDRCPDDAGEEALAGCPPPDRDRDGFFDPEDRCPDQPEVWNGRADRDGCPDRGAPLAHLVRAGMIQLVPAPTEERRGARGAAISRSVRAALPAAVELLRRQRARFLAVVVVADHGLSYGDSVERATRLAERLRAALIGLRAAPAGRIQAVGAGPDGQPRIEIRFGSAAKGGVAEPR